MLFNLTKIDLSVTAQIFLFRFENIEVYLKIAVKRLSNCYCAFIQVLLEAGADIDAVDNDGNTPLHVMCYGEQGHDTQLDSIEILVSCNGILAKRHLFISTLSFAELNINSICAK